jgi:hypothetical protein
VIGHRRTRIVAAIIVSIAGFHRPETGRIRHANSAKNEPEPVAAAVASDSIDGGFECHDRV